MKKFNEFTNEEVSAVPANSVGGGGVEGIGFGPKGEPGGPNSLGKKKKKLADILKRKPVS